VEIIELRGSQFYRTQSGINLTNIENFSWSSSLLSVKDGSGSGGGGWSWYRSSKVADLSSGKETSSSSGNHEEYPIGQEVVPAASLGAAPLWPGSSESFHRRE
jgi:hypothetical protein